jgi:hypothetical protein
VVALPGVQAGAAPDAGPGHGGRAARLRARPELHLGAADVRTGAARDHHEDLCDHDDFFDHADFFDHGDFPDHGDFSDHRAGGINDAERHHDQRFADHVTDDDAATTRRAAVAALLGRARPRTVAEPVALTEADLNHRYTGEP